MRAETRGVEPGWFVYLRSEGMTFRVCRAGEDENGNICRTSEEHELHVEFGIGFRAVGIQTDVL